MVVGANFQMLWRPDLSSKKVNKSKGKKRFVTDWHNYNRYILFVVLVAGTIYPQI